MIITSILTWVSLSSYGLSVFFGAAVGSHVVKPEEDSEEIHKNSGLISLALCAFFFILGAVLQIITLNM